MLAKLMREQDPQAQVLMIDTDPQGHLLPALGSLQPAIHQFADETIVPFRAAYLDSLGTNQHTQSIRDDQRAGININIFCLLPTFSRPRLRLTRAMMENVREAYGVSPIAHPIPSTVRIEEAPSKGLTIAEYDKDAKAAEAAEAYWKLARNVLANAKRKGGNSREVMAP